MATLRRWYVDWVADSVGGGGGTSAFWFESGTGTTVQQARLVDILDEWATFANPAFSAVIQSTVDLVDDTTGLITDQVTVTPPAAVVGTGAGVLTANQNQVVAALKTGLFLNGRRLQGRIFFPGLDSTSLASGQFITADATGLVAAIAAGGMHVFSPTHLTSALVTSAAVGQEVKVLRSRRD